MTSRTQCRPLSGCPGALPRRGPLRTVRATRRGTRLKQPSRAGVSAVGRWWAGAVGVHEAGCRPAVVFRDRLVGEGLADRGVPGLPLVRGVWRPVGEQQRCSAERAESALVAQGVFPGWCQLWGTSLAPSVGPVLGQGGVVG